MSLPKTLAPLTTQNPVLNLKNFNFQRSSTVQTIYTEDDPGVAKFNPSFVSIVWVNSVLSIAKQLLDAVKQRMAPGNSCLILSVHRPQCSSFLQVKTLEVTWLMILAISTTMQGQLSTNRLGIFHI